MSQRQRGPSWSITGRWLCFFFLLLSVSFIAPLKFLLLLWRRSAACFSRFGVHQLSLIAEGWRSTLTAVFNQECERRKRLSLLQKKKKTKMTCRFLPARLLEDHDRKMVHVWRVFFFSFFFNSLGMSFAFAIDNSLEFNDVIIWVGGRKIK